MHTSRRLTLRVIPLAAFFLIVQMSSQFTYAQVSGLVSHWPGEGNANDVVGSNNGTLQGGGMFAPGIAGQAFRLDGVRYIEVPDSPSISITGSFTLEAWINLSDNTNQFGIIEKYDPPGQRGYFLRLGDGKLVSSVCSFPLTCSEYSIGATTLSTGTWHHVASVYDGTSIKVYLDGVLDGSVPTDFTLPDGSTSLKIGARGDDANTRLNGLIDEVKIYNRALSASEIQVSAGGLVSRWRAEGDALDSVGINNGSLLNGTAFTAGVSGQSFSFDGGDDRVSVPNSPSLNVGTGDFTVSLFAKFNDLANNGNGLIHKDTYGNEGGYRGWLLNICDNCAGSPGIGIETRNLSQGIDNNARYPTSNFQIERWYHIAAVRQSNILYLYIDGVLRATVAESGPTDLSNSADLEFGSLSSGSRQNFAGALDEIKFLNRALSAAEIQNIGSGDPTRYDSRPAFVNALCATATTNGIEFDRNDDGTFITIPGADTHFDTLSLSGATFRQARSYYNGFIYTGPTGVITVDLPPNTFAFGTDLAAFYSTPGTYTITLSTGQTYQKASNGARWTSSNYDFFGVISNTPIEWVTFSYDNDYLILDKFIVGAGCDSTSPVIIPTVTGTLGNNGWYTGDVQVSWSVIDAESTVSSSSGCDTNNVSTDDSGVTFTCTATSAGGSDTQSVTIKRDATAPSISCGSADGLWHTSNVSIACGGSDSLSQLADPDDASFYLVTNVASGTETANSATNGVNVCDNAGNCSPAGPLTGNKIDRKAPNIIITTPTSAAYLLNQSVTASFNCQDSGSGVANCDGTTVTGANIDTISAGSKTFTVSAADNVANATSQSVSYTVGFGLRLLYDQTKAVKSGSTIPIKIQLVDALGNNMSSAAIVVHAMSLVQITTTASETINDAGTSNPDANFRFDASLGSNGGYIFNLKTTGLSTGTYSLGFTVNSDPNVYTVQFAVRQ